MGFRLFSSNLLKTFPTLCGSTNPAICSTRINFSQNSTQPSSEPMEKYETNSTESLEDLTAKRSLMKDSEGYRLVYKFPYIIHVRMISRFKIFQTGLTVCFLPLTYTMESPQFMTAITVASAAALGTLAYISNLSRNLIGVMSIDPTLTHVRIGTLTFWGNRRNRYVDIDKIVPLSELDISPENIYMDFRTYDDSEKLYISLRFGGIYDRLAFEKIFGKSEFINPSAFEKILSEKQRSSSQTH